MRLVHYSNNDSTYLIFSTSTKDDFNEDGYKTVVLGLLLNKNLERKMAFLADKKIERITISATPEDCQIYDSQNRIAKPIVLEQREQNKVIEDIVNKINADYSTTIKA